MAFGQRRLVVLLLLFFLVVSSTAVPISSKAYIKYNEVKQTDKDGGLLKMEGLVEGRMNLEVEDYPGTGANHDHDPPPPGKV
ncbi:hypothetical protein DH2020_039143 [Rehmannia glutinosa]|uniref:Uncharacterized protein n=1 Tax=Rehmannia glutinosa TaxID=99300 RepID=A0ABR0UYG4_REHGL